jgi:hypothetical protein
MKRDCIIAARQALLDRLPVTGDLLRGSSDIAAAVRLAPVVMAIRLAVLTVSYPGGRTRQTSLRRAQVPEVRGWLANYQQLKEGIEAICELNHDLLRSDNAAARSDGTKA